MIRNNLDQSLVMLKLDKSVQSLNQLSIIQTVFESTLIQKCYFLKVEFASCILCWSWQLQYFFSSKKTRSIIDD